jgi:3alpha(or 20beta)-hydroxysteroid dehydrogenase
MESKVVLVTGAGDGIGQAIAETLAEHGATVIVTDIDRAAGEAAAAAIGERAAFLPLDVCDEHGWSATVADVLARHGRIDVLVNNAGGGIGRAIEDTPVSEHRRVIGWTLDSVWIGVRAVVPAMSAAGGGAIVNISSIDGLAGVAHLSSYVAAKFGVTGLTRSLAMELGERNIRVNSVHPGITETRPVLSANAVYQDRMAKAIARQPLRRRGKPRDIANAVLFFACDESSYCTGTSLVVDGGHLAGPYRDPVG